MAQSNAFYTLAFGMPDDQAAKAFIGPDGQPAMAMPNLLSLPAKSSAALAENGQMVWFPNTPELMQQTAGLVVNFCADYSTYTKALGAIAQRFPAGSTIFNHPKGIALIASDKYRAGFERIAGLDVPKQVSFRPQTPADFKEVFQKSAFTYPVRVQKSSARNNMDLAVIETQADWPKVQELGGLHDTFTMVQLAASGLSQHLRYRACFVGRKTQIAPFPYAYPPKPVVADLKAPQNASPEQLNKVCSALAQLVPLDFWTVEFSAPTRDQLRLEYIWAGLPSDDYEKGLKPSTLLWPQVEPLVHALLQSPQSWRSWQSNAAKKAN